MINRALATARKLGVRIGYDSEVVSLNFDDECGCQADIAHGGSIERVTVNTMWCCVRAAIRPISLAARKLWRRRRIVS